MSNPTLPAAGATDAPSFAHLHLHTHYSLLDGATRIRPLMDRVKALGMPAVAITDHGNLFGAIEFYRAAHAAGVKPIIGCEVYIAPDSRHNTDYPGRKDSSYHLLLLAMNRAGYQNLLKLSSLAYLEGFYYKPRVDRELLRELNEGLICTSTCLGGEIPQAFVQRDRAAAEAMAKSYLDIFGPDRFYVELQDHGIAEQRVLNPELVDMANRLGVATIATNDVHYLEASDVEAHDILCCISTGKLVSDDNRLKFEGDQFYLKSPAEMAELFPGHPEALANTLRVVDQCDLDFDFSKRFAPVYKVPEDTTPDSTLRKLVYERAERKYGTISDELRERIDYELEVISSKGFSSYFLIVWDLMNFARQQNIPCGARGSGCSSVVAYCLDISAPDPMRYELYFERFMDPDRDEMPDIDVDICQNGRARVIDYVREKYGHVAQIITFGTLKARAAVKDVSRVLGLDFDEANRLTSLIPAELKMTIDKALDSEPELRKQYENDERIRKVIDISRKLEGLARHAGVHAAGVVVADQPLERFLPLYKQPNEQAIVTQFDGPTVEAVGLLKLDFLGLRTLTTLQRAIDLVAASHHETIDREKLDLSDQRVYRLFCEGQTKGIFQFESAGMRDVIMRMKPNRIQDLIAANALYRPGPMEYIDDYVARKHGRNWNTPHPVMNEVLEETYGIMVYQEQVSRLVNRLGGLELKRPFRLAKLISKKNTEKIAEQQPAFIEGCVRNGLDKAKAEQIFEDILKFGGYAFNKAHSTGYALVAFQTAYMKVYWPVEFMAALLTFEMGSTAKVEEYIEECQQMGIEIAPPDINASDKDFTPDYQQNGQKVIRFGLTAIKGVGEKAVRAILDARERGGPFPSLFEFCERVDLTCVNRSVIDALICCGAFDNTGAMRKALINALDGAIQGGQRTQEDRRSGQGSLFGAADDENDDTGPQLSTEEWPEAEMLAREKAVLGFYVTRHPLARYAALIEACASATTADLTGFVDRTPVVLGGIVTGIRQVLLKNGKRQGQKMGVINFEDLKGRLEVTLAPKELERFRHLVQTDAVIFVKGTVNRSRENPSLRADEIIPVNAALGRLTASVVLRLDERLDGDDNLQACFDACRRYRGKTPLYLEVFTDDEHVAIIRCDDSLSVDCNAALLASLGTILPPENVVCTSQMRRAIPWPKTIDPPAHEAPTLAPA